MAADSIAALEVLVEAVLASALVAAALAVSTTASIASTASIVLPMAAYTEAALVRLQGTMVAEASIALVALDSVTKPLGPEGNF